MRYLLDTCVLSELVKPLPAPEVLAWMGERNEAELFVSAMTMAELARGIAKLPASRRKLELAAWLDKLKLAFSDRVLPFTGETAGYWAELCNRAESVGKTMAAFDSIIAATALEHGLGMVTRNVSDFLLAPVVVVNPWGKAG